MSQPTNKSGQIVPTTKKSSPADILKPKQRCPNPTGKGLIPGQGRPKGCKNKFTDLKTAFLNAFNRAGGEDALTKFGKQTKNQAIFFQMLARMLPNKTEVTGPDDGPIKVALSPDLSMLADNITNPSSNEQEGG